MMSLGPVPLPVALAIFFLLLALLVARLWPRPPGAAWRPATALLVDMFLLGLLAARGLFVLRAAPLYLTDPGSILRIGTLHCARPSLLPRCSPRPVGGVPPLACSIGRQGRSACQRWCCTTWVANRLHWRQGRAARLW